ncbi:MAG: hypothetical protein JWN86_1423 [Planctomycetota bacterium]|nr:hypothetical protein [Planctomycetota bacterium]
MISGGFGSLGDTTIRQIQYAIDVRGQTAITDLQDELGRVNAQLAAAAINYSATGNIHAYEQASAALVRRQTELGAQIRLASAAMENHGIITDSMVRKMRTADQASRGMGAGVIQLSYALDDLQYGLQAVQNNVVPVITSFAGSGPLASGIAIVAAGTMLGVNAWKNYDNMIKAVKGTMTSGITVFESNAERIKQLGDITHKTAEETAELTRRKKQDADQDAILAGRSKDEKDRAALVDSAYAESGGAGPIAGKLAEVMKGQGLGRDANREQEIQEYRDSIANSWMESSYTIDRWKTQLAKLIKENEYKTNDYLVRSAAQLLDEAKTDPTKMKVVQGYISKSPGSFDKNIVQNLNEATPERQQEMKQQKEDNEADQKQSDELTEKGKERRKKQADDMAKHLLKEMAPRVWGGESIDKAKVQESLDRAGFKNLDASVLDKVFADANKQFIAQVRNHALEKGLTPQQAMGDLLKEHNEKIAAEKRHQESLTRQEANGPPKTREEREDEQDTKARATSLLGGKNDLGDQMRDAITKRTAQGQDPEVIAQAMRDQAVQIIGQLPEFKGANSDPVMAAKAVNVAYEMVDRMMAKQTGKIAGELSAIDPDSNFQGAAGAMVDADQQATQAKAGKAEVKAGRRMTNERKDAMRNQMGNAFMNEGANPQAAMKMANDAVSMYASGHGLNESMATAMEKFLAVQRQMQASQDRMMMRLNMIHGSVDDMRFPNLDPQFP